MFSGRLTKALEIKFTPNGKAVCNFSLAIPRAISNQNNEKETDFLDFVVWGKAAENMASILSKGDVIGVEARAQKRSYEGNDKKKVYVTEFIVEGFPTYFRVKKWENGGQPTQTMNGSQRQNPYQQAGNSTVAQNYPNYNNGNNQPQFKNNPFGNQSGSQQFDPYAQINGPIVVS